MSGRLRTTLASTTSSTFAIAFARLIRTSWPLKANALTLSIFDSPSITSPSQLWPLTHFGCSSPSAPFAAADCPMSHLAAATVRRPQRFIRSTVWSAPRCASNWHTAGSDTFHCADFANLNLNSTKAPPTSFALRTCAITAAG